MKILASVKIGDAQKVTSYYPTVERDGEVYLVFLTADENTLAALKLEQDKIKPFDPALGLIAEAGYTGELSLNNIVALPAYL